MLVMFFSLSLLFEFSALPIGNPQDHLKSADKKIGSNRSNNEQPLMPDSQLLQCPSLD